MKRFAIATLFLLSSFIIPSFGNSHLRCTKDKSHVSTTIRVVNVQRDVDLSRIINADITNTLYVFQDKHDLSQYGNGLTIGDNCTLEFRKGGFVNGRIKCKSIVIMGRKPEFTEVYIEIDSANHVNIKNINAKYTYAIDDFIKISNSKNIDIENVKVSFDKGNRQLPNGNWIYTEGFDLANCRNVSFNNCTILNAKSRNVDSEHGSLICKNCSDVTIDKCYSSGGYNEVFLFLYCNHATIENTIINGRNGSGITLVGGQDFVIDKCKSINVGASGFSLNAKKIKVTNCLIKNWQAYGGITMGHSPEYARAADVEVSNCIIVNDSGKDHPDPIWAFGGVSEGEISIHDCKIKAPRICTFDFIYNDKPVKLELRDNIINVIKAEGLSNTIECFRASGNYDLVIENNTFIGGAGITGHVQPSDGQPVSNWKIKGNTFKKIDQTLIINPGIKENLSKGTFEFSNNVIEKSGPIDELINVPNYGKIIVDGNKK